MEPSEKGTLVYPSLQGATNWASPSYSPDTGFFYVPVREMGSIYFKSDVEYRPGTYYTGGAEKALDEEAWGSVRALDVDTGKMVWDFKLPSPLWGGVLSTAHCAPIRSRSRSTASSTSLLPPVGRSSFLPWSNRPTRRPSRLLDK